MALRISPDKTRVGWIGTGVMGASMAGHVLKAGYPLTVHTRTKAKADDLVAAGATWADTPKQVAEKADVIFSIVGYPHDVREVVLGEDGALAGCQKGTVLVDMTTSEPSLAVEIAETASAKGVTSIDAPCSGGDVGAREGKLSVMIGGDEETVNALKPLWDTMARIWVRQGGPGAGQHTKVVNQTLIGAGMVAVCEALLYGYRAGLDLETVLESVGSGAAGSWSLTNYGPRIIKGDYKPGFYVEHFLKDMGIALEESRKLGLCMPGLALAEQLYQAVASQGHAKDGTQALIVALAKLSNVDWK